MAAYYNEIDPYAAEWLRRLMAAGLIAPGVVDERSITDVRADDLREFAQCHFFAGIGGWSVALRAAGWPDDRPVWTGSCPCQPFSAAGAGKAADDERHLWPAWFSLIAKRRPPDLFGEQVEAAIGWGWLDAVFADLEGEGYACGAAVLPACSVGAPHIRQRLWFVANADGGHAGAERQQRGGQHGQQPQDGGAGGLVNAAGERHQGTADRAYAPGRGQSAESGVEGDMADAASGGQREQRYAAQPGRGGHADGGFLDGGMANTECDDGRTDQPLRGSDRREVDGGPGFWADAQWITCTDGKSRPIEPGSFPLAHGVQRRPSKLRAYGNAVVPQVAAEFIRAAMEAMSP